ncbi:zinc finger FYVE domain-containing protein 1 [Austrofundulus limnaeus]|uniref:Zinc finger FYVE domain-containing protein 1 n=1 Tax=Austrofundulus limnaeus TaxID=52670 RepID=A0A2I4BJ72_AUSLI|nr:PREDICTED: zinc finger FYVE domain-containing protein 1-like [Austrofundulus limnaeus]
MSGHGSSSEKGVNTSPICQESYSCGGSEEAVFECDDCKSLQCVRCELELHRQESFTNHERVPIGPGHVPYCDTCKGGNGDSGRCHRSVVRCQNCKVNLCQDCQKRTHSGSSKKKHQLTPYPPPPKPAKVNSVKKSVEHVVQIIDEAESRRTKLLGTVSSFLLVDENEDMQIKDEASFVESLCCDPDQLLKVVSIFGNTGEGKSHTLNHTFFAGREVFKTSPAQESCTVGVWAAFDPVHKVVVIDTEGLLGNSSKQGQRTRLLLKVLAISDLIIYRTHADRLHDDLFKFLGDASDAYLKHFTKELKATTARCGLDVPLSTLGPAVVIFHETVHTKLLGSEKSSESVDRLLLERFRKLSRYPEAFSSVQYLGTQTLSPPTDFRGLQNKLEQLLDNNATRSPRTPVVIYKALQALSERFNGEISGEPAAHSCFFPDEYFTCSSQCLSCGSKCKNSMNHLGEGGCHDAKQRCCYSSLYDNRIYTCKACYEGGKEVMVVPKTSASSDSPWIGLARFAWSGYVIECPNCGVIYRSRQYWYGNQDPVDTVVRTEIHHIWPGAGGFLKDNSNAAQRLLDGVNLVAQSVSELSVKPAKAVTSWLTDQIAPAYWKPNSLILMCHKCHTVFQDNDTKHHCRACGEGFCDGCSSKAAPVPERGWGPAPVRVCDGCFEQRASYAEILASDLEDEEGSTLARKVGEAVTNTIGVVVTAIDIPLGLVKDAARPAYWVPDQDILSCHNCQREFTAKLSKHHCRACGQGVCDECSPERRAVPSRGWDHPVRVCAGCNQNPGEL